MKMPSPKEFRRCWRELPPLEQGKISERLKHGQPVEDPDLAGLTVALARRSQWLALGNAAFLLILIAIIRWVADGAMGIEVPSLFSIGALLTFWPVIAVLVGVPFFYAARSRRAARETVKRWGLDRRQQ